MFTYMGKTVNPEMIVAVDACVTYLQLIMIDGSVIAFNFGFEETDDAEYNRVLDAILHRIGHVKRSGSYYLPVRHIVWTQITSSSFAVRMRDGKTYTTFDKDEYFQLGEPLF